VIWTSSLAPCQIADSPLTDCRGVSGAFGAHISHSGARPIVSTPYAIDGLSWVSTDISVQAGPQGR
jgi:hypothetical protein